MDSAIHFTNDFIRVVQGKTGGKQIKITKTQTIPLPPGCMEDGAILHPVHLGKALDDLRRENDIGKSCRITVDSSQILYKTLDLPFMNPRGIAETCRREFENIGASPDEMVFDYAVLKNRYEDRSEGRVLFSAMPRLLLQSYIDLFATKGLSLLSCDIVLNSVIKAVRYFPLLQKDPFILSTNDNHVMSSYLFANGEYLFFNRAQLFSTPGTDEYFAEIAGKFSAIKQFYKAERDAGMLEQAYVYGIPPEKTEQCRTMVAFLGIHLDNLPESPEIIRNDGSPFAVKEYLPAIGCLIRK